MARMVVIDASVVLAKILAEPRPDWVEETVGDARRGDLELIAPPILWLEVGNRLVRAKDMADEFALEAMLRTDALRITTVDFERPLVMRALQLGRDHGLSMYDASYLAVAETNAAPLLTLDRRLERAARNLGLGPAGGKRILEPAASYGDRPVDRTSIAAIGAALAQMRKEYSL